MPQPDSTRDRAPRPWNEAGPWPVDPASPRHGSRSNGRPPGPRPREGHESDARTPADPDGNEELEREQRERPQTSREHQAKATPRETLENEDTGQWAATERFTLDELDDTLPHVPRYTDD